MPLNDYKTALVTGASSGIGAATVKSLTDRGITVHALARRRERLEQLAAMTNCITHALDLRDTDALYETLGGLDIDILVNNAGIGRGITGLFSASPEDITATLELNVTAAAHVVRAVTPGMIQRKRGHIVNLGSVAGLYPIVSAIYGASKGAIHLFNQNLRLELRGSGVRVTEICPGRVTTEFFEGAIQDAAKLEKAKDTGIHELKADDIAAAIMYALDAPWHVNVSTIEITPSEQVFGGLHFAPVSTD